MPHSIQQYTVHSTAGLQLNGGDPPLVGPVGHARRVLATDRTARSHGAPSEDHQQQRGEGFHGLHTHCVPRSTIVTVGPVVTQLQAGIPGNSPAPPLHR